MYMSVAKTNKLSDSLSRPSTTSDIIGLKVYTKNGVYLGKVDDVQVDFESCKTKGIALVDINPVLRNIKNSSDKGVVIPYKWVLSTHDIIITIDVVQRLNTS